MPRHPRRDAPDTLHQVMGRGIERTALFRDDLDRTDVVTRLAALAAAGAFTLFAWALLPTHVHLLVRTGTRSLRRSMRLLLDRRARALARALGQTRGNLSTAARRGTVWAARWQIEILRGCR